MATECGSYGRHRPVTGLAMAVLLTSMAVIAGCAASPYELAERDAETVSADIRQAIDALIEKANRVAAAQDGKVYVDVQQFKRVMAFVPRPKSPISVESMTLRGGPAILPENAVLREWTDRFGLAQELSYRYSYTKIRRSTRQYSPPYFTAEVEVLLKATHRWAYAGKPKDLPATPAGYVAWLPPALFYGTGGSWPAHLPTPGTPPGKVVTPSLPIDAIGQSALDSLRRTRPKKIEHVVVAHMAYDHHKKRWELREVTRGDNFPRRKSLWWGYWVEGDRGGFVLEPGDIRRRGPKDKPFDEAQSKPFDEAQGKPAPKKQGQMR